MSNKDDFFDEIQEASERVVEASLKQANAAVKKLLKDVREEISTVKKNAGVLKIEIGDVKRDLTSRAVPYLDRMIINAKLGLNTMLVGPAGCGKSFSAGQLAESLGLQYGHLNLTAGASETWLYGRQTPKGFVEGVFSKLYREGGVFLADEIDAADPNLLLCINTALANDSMYNPMSGEHFKKHKDFVFIGAANTVGRGADFQYVGRNRLDASTIDRFVMIKVDYDTKVEEELCPDENLRNTLWNYRQKLVDLKATEVISTRTMDQAYRQLQGGIDIKVILDSITLGWPKDIRDRVTAGNAVVVADGTKGKARKVKAKVEISDDIPF